MDSMDHNEPCMGLFRMVSSSHYVFFANLTLYAPAFANLLTRLVTKEGFSDMKLHLRLKSHLLHYLIAWLLPLVAALLSGVLMTVLYGDFNGSSVTDGLSGLRIISAILQCLFLTPVTAFVTFGEEFGWRGYMNDKMKPLFGTGGTVLIGGIIWGIWHAPLTVEGHNFGKEYPGYPCSGFLMMILFCTGLGIILMWLTEKTGSVYPAAIFHAMLNFGSGTIRQLMLWGVSENEIISVIRVSIISQLPLVMLSVLFVIPLLRRKQKADPV